jgi:hypothetical protein
MLDNEAGITLVFDELAGLIRSWGQYKGGKGSDHQEMLSSWNSTDIKIDRKGAPSIVISDPCIPIVGGLTTDNWGKYTAKTEPETGL